MHVAQWPAEWTTEFLDLLTVLSRLIELEELQADVLNRVLAGPVHSRDGLTQRPKDRVVRYPVSLQVDSPTLDLQ
jgi:hypothetical protein